MIRGLHLTLEMFSCRLKRVSRIWIQFFFNTKNFGLVLAFTRHPHLHRISPGIKVCIHTVVLSAVKHLLQPSLGVSAFLCWGSDSPAQGKWL